MQATQAKQTRDEAIERFNAGMANAVTSPDREEETRTLVRNLGSLTEALRIYSAGLAKQDRAAREVRWW